VSTQHESSASARRLEPQPAAAVRVGQGHGSGHYGELFQGQIHDDTGALRRCLVTLPCQHLQSRAWWQPGGVGIRVWPDAKTKARRTAELTLASLDRPEATGLLTIESNICAGKGNGSSSADCVAAARAVTDAFGAHLPDRVLARIVVAAEMASDSVMFDRAVLFAHRDGVVLEDYGCRLPSLDVIGIDAQPEGAIDTLQHPLAEYSPSECDVFRVLVDALKQAVRTEDLRLLGEVATASALVNQRFLPNPCFQELSDLATSVDALGVAVAHSGTVVGILLDPADPGLERKAARVQDRLQARGNGRFMRFRSC
jgi:uncharacterized protein involved in propanediol utilization